MDPTTTYIAFLKAFDAHDQETSRELGQALADWLERDGCWPARCCRTVVRACLEQVLGRKLNVPLPKLPTLFELGETVITANAHAVLTSADVQAALDRHQRGDWGELEPADRVANERALINGSRILSAYISGHGVKFWLITEADRSSTTVLLPEDY